jgi:hypothetical protein
MLLALLSMIPPSSASAGELGGSLASMRRQYQVAKKNAFTFLRTSAQVREFVRQDRLVAIESNEHLLVNNVSFPYARPEVSLFIERLAAQYHAATGERLVVTSLTRPLSRQPRNAHRLSVHPTGMAVDLRIPKGRARKWLESTLLQLEGLGLIDATRERRPPHYHIAVYPTKYGDYVERLIDKQPTVASAATLDVQASLEPAAETDSAHLEVAIEAAKPVSQEEPLRPLLAALGLTGVVVTGAFGAGRRRERAE